jgi:hypothetical protein
MKSETKDLARALAMELAAIADMPKCEWIAEKKAIDEFPYSLDQLRDMRGKGDLVFRMHWKYNKAAKDSRKKPGVIYHRQRMIEYVEQL